MKELYGVLGYTDTKEEIIHGALDDLRTTVDYLIPWYGVKPIPTALVAVYDWMLDNEASYTVVASQDGSPCPKALREGANGVYEVENPSVEIIERLSKEKPSGFALVMWDEVAPENSLSIAATCISRNIPTLDLTSGLVPIIMNEDEVEITVEFDESQIDIKDMPIIDPREWDEETLDVMPASSVKKMARDAGHDVKTKAEAIKALKGTSSVVVKEDDSIGRLTVSLNDGSELSFSINQKLLKEILDLVVESQS